MFSGSDQSRPAQASSARSRTAMPTSTATGIADTDGRCSPATETNPTLPSIRMAPLQSPLLQEVLATDGTDTISATSKCWILADQDISLLAPTLDLHGPSTTTTTTTVPQAYRDTVSGPLPTPTTMAPRTGEGGLEQEAGDRAGAANAGDIQITGGKGCPSSKEPTITMPFFAQSEQ